MRDAPGNSLAAGEGHGTDEPSAQGVHKRRLGRSARFVRLLVAMVDPRAWMHLVKVVNFYNYTHVAELRKVRRGPGVSISPTASFANGENIVLGPHASIGAHVQIWAGRTAQIELGDYALISPDVMLTAANYRIHDGTPVTEQAMNEAPISIGPDVWIGRGVTVLRGVTIGAGAVISAGAVVYSDIPAYSVAAGNPARVVGRRRCPSAPDTAAPTSDKAGSDRLPEAPSATLERRAPGRLHRRHALEGPGVALAGMGDPWLFRELGDLHGSLIRDARRTETPRSPSPTDDDPATTTILRCKADFAPGLSRFTAPMVLDIHARLDRHGSSIFLSRSRFEGEGDARGQAIVASRFAERGAVDGDPALPRELSAPSPAGAAASTDNTAAVFVREYLARCDEPPWQDVIFECDYTILPPHDLDGAGRLCFAAHPTIYDLCLERAEGAGFLRRHSTAGKDLFYFADTASDDILKFRLHARRDLGGGRIEHRCSLSRAGDGTRLSEVVSVKLAH